MSMGRWNFDSSFAESCLYLIWRETMRGRKYEISNMKVVFCQLCYTERQLTSLCNLLAWTEWAMFMSSCSPFSPIIFPLVFSNSALYFCWNDKSVTFKTLQQDKKSEMLCQITLWGACSLNILCYFTLATVCFSFEKILNVGIVYLDCGISTLTEVKKLKTLLPFCENDTTG